MERDIVDANWGLNGEDEKSLWEEWEVDKKDDDGKEGHDSGNASPPSITKVRISLLLLLMFTY